MAAAAPAASCMSMDRGCGFDCLVHLWEWLDPPVVQSQYPMENKKSLPATQQPLTQQHLMAHHVHPDQIYSPQQTQLAAHLTSAQTGQIQPNGVMHQLLQSQYHSNMNARSPLLENRHELYGTGLNQDYTRHYGANDNYNYPQSPPRHERTDVHTDHNVNHELLHNIPKGYNAEVYQDYLKRNPPKDANQIYQNHQPMYRPNSNAYGSKPYLPYSNRIGPQSNTELLRRQYNELQQMKLQQQMHYQNQAQMHQQQKFAERQLLLQQIHGVQPPPNLQNSIYSDGSYRDLDRYSSKNDFKDYSSPDIHNDIEMYTRNEMEKQNRHYLESQWQTNQPLEYREPDRHRRQSESDKGTQSPPSDYNKYNEKNNVGVVSPMKSSESSSPSIKSPSSEGRRSSGGNQALRSPIAQRIPSAPVAMSGILYKQGSDGLKVWRKRWFVLSEYCLFYYKSQDEEKLLGSVLLPSYKVSACTPEDKVLRKFSFKLEHANMRTYVLAAPDQESMLKWVKVLTMAALMQSPKCSDMYSMERYNDDDDDSLSLILLFENLSEGSTPGDSNFDNEQPQKQSERPSAKTEESDEIPGPTYANAPPKPRRSNEGYNSPSPDMYDPNYDILKKPASHYSQGTSHTRYQDHTNYPSSSNQESTYTRSPPPAQPTQYQTKRPYDTHHLSLPLTNTVTDKLENNQPSTSSAYKSNPQSPYFNDRSRNQHQQQPMQENAQEKLYDTRQGARNPFLQDNTPQMEDRNVSTELQIKNNILEQERVQSNYHDSYSNLRSNSKSNIDSNIYNKDIYGEMTRTSRGPNVTNERLLVDRRTPDAYGRANTAAPYIKGKIGDYEDVYGMYAAENDYGKTYSKSPPQSSQTNTGDDMSSTKQQRQQQQDHGVNNKQEKTFSGPSVLRKKKTHYCVIATPIPRPHSADFLEYEKSDLLKNSIPAQKPCDPPRQPQRPKSSLDINSYYDPSSDRYYSEESYAEKMRQSAQYLQQQGLGPKNIQIPLAKYASGLAEKQLNSPYSQITNNNYETEFAPKKPARDNTSFNSKYSDLEGLNSNWTLKEKGIEHQKDILNRSGSVMSDGSNSFAKENMSRFDPTSEGFMRSASARLPSSVSEKEGDKKIQQREESMKRLLEWKQRMLQSPLTRKSTPAAISLARSLNQSRQSLRSDQYKSKTYSNAIYNSYSSDDEEETTGTDVENTRDKQAGRSHRTNLTSPNIIPLATPYAPCTADLDILKINYSNSDLEGNKNSSLENTYENIDITLSTSNLSNTSNTKENTYEYSNINKNVENIEDNKDTNEENECGYETHESEAESETQIEYTDNDLDEVLMESDGEVDLNSKSTDVKSSERVHVIDDNQTLSEKKPETPPVAPEGEDHYLPMSPRKTSSIELTHQMVLQNLSVFNDTMPVNYEDNPYVEMNIGNEEEDMQTYEVVCVTGGKVEPVYMELNLLNNDSKSDIDKPTNVLFDSASNFADTKDHTVKRALKSERISKKSDSSDSTDDETTKDELPINTPFNRFSISDTFRPASYYLSRSRNVLVRKESSDSDIISPPPVPSSTPPYEELSDEALSKYVLEKLDESDMSQDNSILKMLTNENQTIRRRKTTSLMIYGSRTSIHDTLTRGEKIRNSRASLPNERQKLNEESPKLLTPAILENYNTSSIESDSLRSYNADRGSSRLSLESDISSKFEIAPSNLSSEVASLNESEMAIDLRYPMSSYQNLEMMLKRRPLSDDSIFELSASQLCINSETTSNVDLDRFLDKLQPIGEAHHNEGSHINTSSSESSVTHKDNNTSRTAQSPLVINHMRCSSTPVGNSCKSHDNKQYNNQQSKEQLILGYTGSQISCSSVGITKSPISYYTKGYDEEQLLSKNLNKDISDKIKQFEIEKLALKSGNETNASSTSTGFHSRDSSAEHSAPYYYSDLSSQEHINVLPTSHFLKNTNLHRRLNNQRRRGPPHKKNEISHIHNPIHNNQIFVSERSFELVASARSVSVEFLSAADKDPEIDMKNIYESSDGRHSKIPESMNLISGLSCKRNSSYNNAEASSPDSNIVNRSAINSSSIQISNASMSSHCSGTSSNTVYYDAEAEAGAYENVICHGEKHWDEDALWRDNLRRVSHRHARSMDDLDTVESPLMSRVNSDMNAMNSIKRVKKGFPNKISRHVTYVNCDIQGQLRIRENSTHIQNSSFVEEEKVDDNDVYVSLAEDTEVDMVHSDEGVYEQLVSETALGNSRMQETHSNTHTKSNTIGGNKKRFEIDREKLRQWDLMSSGLLKRGSGCVRGAGVGTNRTLCNTDTGTDNASKEASMTISGAHMDSGSNNNLSNQQALSKKAFLGSNTSIGRNTRDSNIPVRAVSPRVRWVEDKTNDHYGSQQMSTSQQNLHTLSTEDAWASTRSPSRASQQPIRAVSPRVRRNTETDDLQRNLRSGPVQLGEVPTAGELLGRTHEELVLLLIQLRRRHAATHRAIEHYCAQITSTEESLSSLKAIEREENLQRLEQLKMQLMELELQYEKSKPLVQLVDNMVKLGSLYNKPGSTVERLERNQRLRQKVLAEHAMEQQRWLESAAAGKPLETEAARARVAELWALEQELADEAAILQGLKTDKDTLESLLTGVRGRLDNVPRTDITRSSMSNVMVNSGAGTGLEAELARVHAMLAHNSKKLEQTVADNARLERELQQLRRALQARRAAAPAHPTAVLEDEVTRVQQLVSALQRQRQELSRAVRHLTQQSHALQTTHDSMPGNQRRPTSSWHETNLDTGYTIEHGQADYDYDTLPAGHYGHSVETPLYVDTRPSAPDLASPGTDDMHGGFANLSNVEKQEIKTVRIVKRESERRQRDRERSLQPMSDWSSNNITANLDQFIEEELGQSLNHTRASSVPRTDFSKFEEYYAKPQEPPTYLHISDKNMELSPKYPSSPSLSNYDYSRDIASLSNSYHKSYDKSGHDRNISISTQNLNGPTDSSKPLTNDPSSKTSSIVSFTRTPVFQDLSPLFKSEAAKQIIIEMTLGEPRSGSLHRRQVPKEKRRHNTAPHHLSAKTLNELPKDGYNQDKLGRSLDDADMERALRGAAGGAAGGAGGGAGAPDVVRSARPARARLPDTIDQLLAAPQKILIPERYIPEKPPELSPEEQQKRQEKVESIKKMLSGSSADPNNKSPDGEEKRQREHLLQMNQILAKQVTEMSKIIAEKALEELPERDNDDLDDRSPDVELPIYQQRDNFFT